MYRGQHINGSEHYPYRRQPGTFINENFPSHQAHINQQLYPSQQQFQQGTPFEYFTKPEQPNHWPMAIGQDNPNFYPSQYPINNQDQSPGFLTQFQDENGQMNFDKVLSTVSQLANTFQQVTPVIQQVSAMIKTFR